MIWIDCPAFVYYRTTCTTCGKKLRASTNRSGYCKPHAHHANRQQADTAYEVRYCAECGAKLKSGARYGYCDKHLRLSADYRAKELATRRISYASYRNHGLTAEEYEALGTRQGWRCLCGVAKSSRGLPLHIDHDHSCCPGVYSCGKCVRGLLCDSCNMGLGKLKDDPALLRAFAAYLETSRVP